MFRRCRRAVALVIAITDCIVRAGWTRLRGPLTLVQRALWLQRSAWKVLAAAGIEWRVLGVPATSGLVVSNHLSYLDIPVFAAAMPCAFVSKIEVSRWPVFGLAAQLGGSIFLDRTSRDSADAAALEIAGRLHQPIPILMFPEGTSSDGTRVLRFHSRLFEPAVAAGASITTAAIAYAARDGVPESEVCWFGDEGFLGNLWRILGVNGLGAKVVFGEPRSYPDRRTAARETQAAVEATRARRCLGFDIEAVVADRRP